MMIGELDSAAGEYSTTYSSTEEYRLHEEETIYNSIYDLSQLPSALSSLIMKYYSWYYDSDGVPTVRQKLSLWVKFTRYLYTLYELDWELQIWLPNMLEQNVFIKDTYEGYMEFSGDYSYYSKVAVDIIADGETLGQVDHIALDQQSTRGLRVMQERVSGVWQEEVVERKIGRTGDVWYENSQKVEFELDSSWPYNSAYTTGTMTANGEYLKVTSIPTGSGWHGPSHVRTLPSHFRLADLASFNVDLGIYHGGTNGRMGKTVITLYDTNQKRVAYLMVGDAWAGSKKNYFYAAWYDESGSGKSVRADYLYTDARKNMSIRYDPLQGLFAKMTGMSETQLAWPSQMNEDRIISHIVITTSRYSSYAEHDIRIHSIELRYAGSRYTDFFDNCNDMDGFPKDRSFPWGSDADGTLSVPSGQSYMKWSSIATGSGWHGPTYVHTLAKPFRLYQLEEFSAIGEMVQSSSTMGKSYVALFDENQQIVALVYMGDAWVGSKKGWFNVYYYPQSGGSYSQTSGYIYTSFTKTGSLWWEEGGQTGQGVIKSSIDGQVTTLASAENAERVIKYVVTLGYRYNSYSLVDMRIHDIDVKADVKQLNPNLNPPPTPPPEEDPIQEPVPHDYDGTIEGTADETTTTDVDVDLQQEMVSVSSYWTGLWPVFHILIEWQYSTDARLTLHFSIDFLLDFQLYPDGLVALFNPVLDANGYTTEAEKNTKIQESVYRACQAETEIGNPWSRVDEALLLAGIAGFLLGVHPVGTLLWLAAFGYLCITVINAIGHEVALVNDGYKDRVDSSVDIMYKGLIILTGGSIEFVGGIGAMMAAEEMARFYTMRNGYKMTKWGKLHDAALGGIISGLAIIGLGAVTAIWGFLYGIGVIDV